eukprot:CAMPEP_0194667060 /NCGR_PEP_ID=MMETSP0295-20121207/3111_1 /TAXON_ID=39354 /ORGANISM="Heterosigma akashiwo, Strain CCMP2393" /LENGTH=113 /DNA_ID=CAMNT_0039549479 /DNA_START=390 /DNA_END=728 /DNA_ORIENTATION=+
MPHTSTPMQNTAAGSAKRRVNRSTRCMHEEPPLCPQPKHALAGGGGGGGAVGSRRHPHHHRVVVGEQARDEDAALVGVEAGGHAGDHVVGPVEPRQPGPLRQARGPVAPPAPP